MSMMVKPVDGSDSQYVRMILRLQRNILGSTADDSRKYLPIKNDCLKPEWSYYNIYQRREYLQKSV